MHFQMKIQPINNQSYEETVNSDTTPAVKPVLKSRLKRLFDRQFPSCSVQKNNSETATRAAEVRDGEFEPSSVCLAKMVQNYIEDAVPERPTGRNRCNCFNGNIFDVSDDEFDLSAGGSFDSFETLKSLSHCTSVVQRNLLADTSKIIEKNKNHKRKHELRKILAEGLASLGYNASVCKSRWEKSSSYPAGEYEYLDVLFEDGERVILDPDFRSEFEIARPTVTYKAILQSLPYIFAGDEDRLLQILSIVSEAAKQSLKKKGMHVPPWRKFEYMRSKWLSTHIRTPPSPSPSLTLTLTSPPTPPPTPEFETDGMEGMESGVFELVLGEETTSLEAMKASRLSEEGGLPVKEAGSGFEASPEVTWQPPAVKPRSKLVVTGLASLFREKA